MDTKEQAAGEARVERELIRPLQAVGLARPSTMTKAVFDVMLKELRQKLAYMSLENLELLREWVEGHPGGKDGDRFPIALKILKKAREIQTPEAGPSRLMLNVFRHGLGQEALAKGWAPELLDYLRGAREFPGPFTVTQIKKAADDPVRKLADIEMRMRRGDQMRADELAFLDKRRAQIARCAAIAAQATGSVEGSAA